MWGILFFKNHGENEKWRLVPELKRNEIKKDLYEVKTLRYDKEGDARLFTFKDFYLF